MANVDFDPHDIHKFRASNLDKQLPGSEHMKKHQRGKLPSEDEVDKPAPTRHTGDV